MRIRPTRLLAVTVAVAALAAPAPAQAGGPTSVLLSVPGADSTASLYYLDPEYEELSRLLGVTAPSGTFEPTAGPPSQGAPGVNVTWLIHDVSPWRLDRVVLTPQGPWIATQLVPESGTAGPTEPVWHRPAEPAALVGLLEEVGLDLQAAAEPGFEGVAGEPLPEQLDEAGTPAQEAGRDTDEDAGSPAGSSSETAAEPSRTPGWAWAGGGLLVGLLAGLLAGALASVVVVRRRGRTGSETLPPESSDEQANQHPAEVLVR